MCTLLLVDDSSTARSIVARVLGDEYKYVSASSGESALEQIKSNPPDLIILDLLMPGMDGFGVLAVLKSMGNKIPVLVLSADIQKSTRDRVFAMGATGMENKPPRPESFRKAVKDAMEKVVP